MAGDRRYVIASEAKWQVTGYVIASEAKQSLAVRMRLFRRSVPREGHEWPVSRASGMRRNGQWQTCVMAREAKQSRMPE